MAWIVLSSRYRVPRFERRHDQQDTSSAARYQPGIPAAAASPPDDILVLADLRKSYVDGEEMVGLSDDALNRVRRKFGMVYQYTALLDSVNVMDNVVFPLVEHTKLSKREIHDRVIHPLEILGLDVGVATKFSSELSGGMRKRVDVARAASSKNRASTSGGYPASRAGDCRR